MKKIAALGVVVLILVAGTVWAVRRHRIDPQMEKVLKLQAKAFDRQLPEDQRRAMGNQIRTEVGKLPPTQQRQVFGQMMARFQGVINERAAAYCKLPPDQRTAYLDQQIAEMQKFRQGMESQRAADQAQSGGNAQNGNAPGGPGGRPNWATMDQQTRNNFRNQMLNGTTPEQRAQFGAFIQDFKQRCQELGVTLPGMGGRF